MGNHLIIDQLEDAHFACEPTSLLMSIGVTDDYANTIITHPPNKTIDTHNIINNARHFDDSVYYAIY